MSDLVMCSDAHFDAIADWAAARKMRVTLPVEMLGEQAPRAMLQCSEVFAGNVVQARRHPQLVAAVLRDENARSAACAEASVATAPTPYAFKPVAQSLSPRGAFNAVRYYRSMASAHAGWEWSLADLLSGAIMEEAAIALQGPESKQRGVTVDGLVEEGDVR